MNDVCELFEAWIALWGCLGSSFLEKFDSKTRILETHHFHDDKKSSKTSKIVLHQNRLRIPSRSGAIPGSYLKRGSLPGLASDRVFSRNSIPKTRILETPHLHDDLVLTKTCQKHIVWNFSPIQLQARGRPSTIVSAGKDS